MGTGYTRNDTPNNIADGNVINASDLDGEFDAIQAAFNATTGHSHDGTTGEGPQIGTGGIANLAVTTGKIANDAVTLGTKTSGNYVATGAVSGVGLSGSASAEGATFTVTSNATSANTASTIVARDASGNFSAGTITASLSGNATTATTASGVTANSVALGTDTTGNYVATITAGTGITGSSSSEGGTPTIALATAGAGAATYGSTSDGTKIDTITLDAYGRVTAVATGATGDIQGVTAGTNLTGGGTSGTVTINMATGGAGSGTYGSTDDGTKIDTITLDAYGRVTAVATGATMDRWILEDGDGTEVVINSDNEVKFVEGGGVDINWTDTSTGSDGDPYDLTFTINTGVTAGNGLTGGGTLNATRTINVGAGTGIDVAADSISVDVSDFMSNGSNNRIITATGTDAMNAEANLTFDGSSLNINGNINDVTDIYLEDQILHAGDTDTYLQFHAENSFRVVTGGTEKMEIGTHVAFNDGSNDVDFRVESNNNTHMLFVDAGADRVLLGTSSAPVLGTERFGVEQTGATAGCFGFKNNNTSNATLGGMWQYAGTTAGSGSYVIFYNGSGGSQIGSISHTASGTTYNTTSDRRLKTDIQPIADATDKLMQMQPVTHKWIADPDADAVHGFIAQEMQEICPEAVNGKDGGEEMMSMDYGRITPVLVAALQEAANEIRTLKERVAELEAK